MQALARLAVVAVVVTGIAAAPEVQERRILRTAGQLRPLANPSSALHSWPSFRGPNASGIADGQNLPDHWAIDTGENILWRIPIPGLGHSSPVVWGDRIFVTTAISSKPDARFVPGLYGAGAPSDDRTSQRWVLYCIDKRTGKTIWERVAFEGAPVEKRHMKSTYASATPATDGRIVVAWFGSQGVATYNLDGTLRWKVDLGHLDVGAYNAADLEWGTASSPVIWNNLVFLQADTHKDSFLLALDAATGEVRWKADRVELPSWGTPTVVTTPAGSQLVTNGSNFIRAYEPEAGNELWRLGRSSQITAPTPIFADGLIVVASGRAPERPIFVVRPTAKGDITLADGQTSNDSVVWSRNGRGPYMPTPLAYNHLLYVLENNGVVRAYTLATGEQLYEARMPVIGSGYSASFVAADGKLYASGEDGDMFVLGTGSEFKHIATNPMGEALMATPALSQGVMYVRTSMSLVAIGHAPKAVSQAERVARGLVDSRPSNSIAWTAGGVELAAASKPIGTVVFTITTDSRASAFAGTWTADVAGANQVSFRLQITGTSVAGEMVAGPNTLKLAGGSVKASEITFEVVAPSGDRTVVFRGTVKGDEISFVRTVRVREGGNPGGAGIFGVAGAPKFVARRARLH